MQKKSFKTAMIAAAVAVVLVAAGVIALRPPQPKAEPDLSSLRHALDSAGGEKWQATGLEDVEIRVTVAAADWENIDQTMQTLSGEAGGLLVTESQDDNRRRWIFSGTAEQVEELKKALSALGKTTAPALAGRAARESLLVNIVAELQSR